MADQPDSAEILGRPLALPCGITLRNRFGKAPTSEHLAERSGDPGPALDRLYRVWSAGGCGLIVTGNVMVDRGRFEAPRNPVFDELTDPGSIRSWAAAVKSNGNAGIIQISHPGRQQQRGRGQSVAPSAVRLEAPGLLFGTPRELTDAEIQQLIRGYANTARIAVENGFDGVQLHAAHGYLISQFLSPIANRRTDRWGGDREGRSRFLMEVLAAVRDAVGPDRIVAAKVNSADFQRGGFDNDDSIATAKMLEAGGLDLLEVSGGTYEDPQMLSALPQRASTIAREAYFLDFAERLRGETSLPLMVTGGFRSSEAMAAAVASGATDVVGLARPLTLHPDLPNRILSGESLRAEDAEPRSKIKFADAFMGSSWHNQQYARIAAGKPVDRDRGALTTLALATARLQRDGLLYGRR
jgi:2,4-dienoyl-CoA reductase-like NADH-dependent reductase (Old Yellow Enzyme family)